MNASVSFDCSGGGATFDVSADAPGDGFNRIVSMVANLDCVVVLRSLGRLLADVRLAAGTPFALDASLFPDVRHAFRVTGSKTAGVELDIVLTLSPSNGEC